MSPNCRHYVYIGKVREGCLKAVRHYSVPNPPFPPPLCSAGVGRTGVFITLSIVLERMRYEGVVDIFQTVKMLRTQRPAMVQTEVGGGETPALAPAGRQDQRPLHTHPHKEDSLVV